MHQFHPYKFIPDLVLFRSPYLLSAVDEASARDGTTQTPHWDEVHQFHPYKFIPDLVLFADFLRPQVPMSSSDMPKRFIVMITTNCRICEVHLFSRGIANL
jgi:hypothetical protein